MTDKEAYDALLGRYQELEWRVKHQAQELKGLRDQAEASAEGAREAREQCLVWSIHAYAQKLATEGRSFELIMARQALGRITKTTKAKDARKIAAEILEHIHAAEKQAKETR